MVFKKQIDTIPIEKRVYVDESGIDTFMNRSHGLALRGEKFYGKVSGRRFARESFSAKRGKEILAPICYRGTCNAALFNMWLDKHLLPDLKEGDVIIMDNAAFHKSDRTRELIERAGCNLLYLPPYSPDLNPIEIF